MVQTFTFFADGSAAAKINSEIMDSTCTYTGKLLLVQTFAEVLVNPLEEISVVLIFAFANVACARTICTFKISLF